MDLFLQLTLAGLAIGSIYSCVALSVVMVYQASDHFNFAQGEMAMFSTYIAWTFLGMGTPIWLAFVLAVALSFLAGIIIAFASMFTVFTLLSSSPAFANKAEEWLNVIPNGPRPKVKIIFRTFVAGLAILNSPSKHFFLFIYLLYTS